MAFFIQCFDPNGFPTETIGPFDSYTKASDYAEHYNFDMRVDYEIEYLPTEN